MKNIIIVLLLLLLSNFVSGQNYSAKTETLPVVVSNIAFFPPARTQQNVPDCSYFSMIYYLKSYVYNKYYNRNPKLPENQFSHSFAWNQNIDPVYEMSDPRSAFYFMKSQGCATVADFPLTETSTKVKPSLEVREKALAFKSKRLFISNFVTPQVLTKEQVAERIESLKDSLANGKCFSLSFRLFDSFMKLSNKNNVFSCYPGTSADSIRSSHVATVVGYNDTIKTASGRGAFEVIDSNTALISNGIFYFDYRWFYSNLWDFSYFFLEEDFSSQAPKVVMNIELSGAISGKEIGVSQYLFTDTVIVSNEPRFFGERLTFEDLNDFIFHRNQLQVIAVNKIRIPSRDIQVFFPFNNLDGHYSIVTDLSSIENLQSLSVMVQDPISAKYVDDNNEVIYSYDREANCQINQASINLIDLGKKIVAKISDLPDTTIVVNNFYSNELTWYRPVVPYPGIVHVKSCTSVLKRQLITFTIEENVPVFVNPPTTLNAVVNQTLSYTFQAKDKENNPITYYLQNELTEASLSSSGKLTFKSSKTGTCKFTVVASNSKAITTLPVSVKVDLSDAVEDIEIPEVSAKVFPNPMSSNATVELLLAKREAVNIVIYDYLGRQLEIVANDIYEAGEQTINYDAYNLKAGVYIFKISAGSFQKSIKVVKH